MFSILSLLFSLLHVEKTLSQCPATSGPVVIPTSVVTIAAHAYEGCSTLISLVVVSTVTSIGTNKF